MLHGTENTSRYDFPFTQRDSYAVLPWVLGFMVYLTLLCAVLAMNITQMREHWQANYGHSVTLHLPATGKQVMAVRDGLAQALATHADVEKVAWLQEDAVRTLLVPWLGDSTASASLPLPMIADVQLASKTDTAVFKQWVLERFKGVEVEDHAQWLSEFNRLVATIGRLAIGIVLLIAVLTSMIIIMSTRTDIALHQATVDLLRGLGAENRYIAWQFVMKSFAMSMRGVAIGVIGAMGTVGLFWMISRHLQTPFLPSVGLGWAHGVMCVLIVGASLALTALAARATVLKQLKMLDGVAVE
jgi:cell division transport system permease protein